MKPYLIFSDLDGTLTDTKGEINNVTKNTITDILDAGHTFYICTGRMIQSGIQVAQSLDERIKVIGSNGGVIEYNNEYHINQMNKKDIQSILDITFNQKLPMFLFGLDTILYSQKLPKFIMNDTKDAENRTSSSNHTKLIELTEENRYELVEHTPIANAIIFFEDVALRDTLQAQLETNPAFHVTNSHVNNLEIMPKDSSKGIALQKVTELLGFDPSQTMAFGDSNNDIEMLKVAHQAVAMGNATETLKEVATHHALHTDDNGFAEYIRKLNII